MSLITTIGDTLSGLFSGSERVHIQKNVSLTESPRQVICYRCERELGPDHDEDRCQAKGMSRRVFFGLMGASAAALTARVNGIPLPGATIQVRAYAGDMFEVETLNPFTLAWDSAKTRAGNPFKSEDGLLSEGGLLEFHGQDLARPDKWLRVHRGLAEMNILGVMDKTTGKPVKYRIIRNEDAEQRVGAAMKNVMLEHDAAARAVMAEKWRIEAAWREKMLAGRDVKEAEYRRACDEHMKVIHSFDDQWRAHPSVLRKANGLSLGYPKGALPA